MNIPPTPSIPILLFVTIRPIKPIECLFFAFIIDFDIIMVSYRSAKFFDNKRSKSIINVKNKHSMGLMGRMVTNNKIGMEGVGGIFIL